MNRSWNPSELLREMAIRLGSLRERVMFVGGAVTWLHVTDKGVRIFFGAYRAGTSPAPTAADLRRGGACPRPSGAGKEPHPLD